MTPTYSAGQNSAGKFRRPPLQVLIYSPSCDFITEAWLLSLNPLNGRSINWLHFAIQIFNFRHSGTLVLSPECQSARVPEIINVG